MKSSDNYNGTKIRYDAQNKIETEKMSQQLADLQNAGLINPERKIASQLNEMNTLLRKLVENTDNIATALNRNQK